MAPIVSIVGKSDSGKTTLIEKLVPELIKRGYRVGTVKHDAHQFDIDHPGKDSWRHKQAGAEAVVISSPAKAAMVTDVSRELTIDEIAGAYLHDVDIILTEGFKREDKPKIEVMANGDRELLSLPSELVAVATDDPGGLGVPAVGRDDISAIADIVERRFLMGPRGSLEVELVVNGQPIALKPIMQTMVANTVLGLISSLKGVDKPRTVDIRLRGAAPKADE